MPVGAPEQIVLPEFEKTVGEFPGPGPHLQCKIPFRRSERIKGTQVRPLRLPDDSPQKQAYIRKRLVACGFDLSKPYWAVKERRIDPPGHWVCFAAPWWYLFLQSEAVLSEQNKQAALLQGSSA